jgi:hypothetical protein
MNKTMKIIAIVLLVMGALALVGGVLFGLIGRNLIGRGMVALNPQNFPQMRGGNQPMMGGRNLPGGFRSGRGFGFFSLPFWLIGGGLALLIAGVVLLIFNRRKVVVAEPAVASKEKAPAAKKSTKEKSA